MINRSEVPHAPAPAPPMAALTPWSWPRIWAVSLGAATLIGVMEALHGYVGFHLAGEPLGGFTMPEAEPTLGAVLSRALPSWVWVGVVMPGAIALARRFPLRPGISRRHVGVHVLGAAVFAALFVLGASTLRFSLFILPVNATPYSVVVFRYYAIYYNIFFLYYWTVVGVYSAIRYYREASLREVEKRELEAIASRARLDALRRQLHPHFLFNLLSAISSLMLEGDRRSAVRSLSDLSQLLRVSFARSQDFVPLRDEIEFLEMYVALHRLRLEDRLRLERRIDPAAADAMVPTFLLQPLVENAIEHGVARRGDGGAVRVEARARNGTLEITVTNPVAGGLVGWARSSSGVGLANTRERIARTYAEAGSFDFRTDSEEAVARIVLPLRETMPVNGNAR